MSEVIENFIRRNPEMSEKDAFAGFLNEDRIKAWVGVDEGRKDRLRKEFGRVWGQLHVAGQVDHGRAGPSGPKARAPAAHAVHVEVQQTPDKPAVAPPGTPGGQAPGAARRGSAAIGGGRHLQVLCANCKRIEVWMDEDKAVACRACGHVYHDMLQLIRVTPVGPFAFLFGEGWKGAAMAGGIVVGLAALYALLRGF